MGCSGQTIEKGKTVSIQSTSIYLLDVPNNCSMAICNITFPWNQTLYHRQFTKNTPITYRNPADSNEFVKITLTNTYCIWNYDHTKEMQTATFEVCYDVPRDGAILCRTDPSGATVLYDNKPVQSKTPIQLTGVSPGTHTIKFTLDGYDDFESEYNVAPGQTVLAYRALQKNSGSIHASSSIEGVWAAFSGQGISGNRETPATWDNVPQGTYEVTFRKTHPDQTFTECKDTVTVTKGETAEASCTMTLDNKTTLTLNKINENIAKGAEITLAGRLEDAYGDGIANAEITFNDKDLIFDTKLGIKAITGAAGLYAAKWTVADLDWLDSTVELYAEYKGDSDYDGSKSDVQILETKGTKTHLTLESPTSGVVEGDLITFTGKLTDDAGTGIDGIKIGLYDYDAGRDKPLTDENENPISTVTVNGDYSIEWKVKSIDFWNQFVGPKSVSLRAKSESNETYASAVSAVKIIDISSELPQSKITLNNISSNIKLGSTIQLNGKLTTVDDEAIPDATISFLEGSAISSKPLEISGETNDAGEFSVNWTVIGSTGRIVLRSTFEESDQYRGSTSSFVESNIVETLPDIKNSITVDVTNRRPGHEYEIIVTQPTKRILSDKYDLGRTIASKWCRDGDCNIIFTEQDELLENEKYYITAVKIPPLSVELNELETFLGNITINRSTKETSDILMKICEMMNIADCSTFVENMTLDLMSPLMDLNAIVTGEDPHTGEVIDDVTWYYVFALLGFGSVLTAVPKTILKGLKVSAEGVKIANAARKSSALMDFLKEPGILTKVLLYTSEQANGFLQAIAKGMPETRSFWDNAAANVDMTKIGDIGKNIDDVKATTKISDEAANRMKDLVKTGDIASDFFNKFTDFLKTVENGTTKHINPLTATEFIDMAKTNPGEIKKIINEFQNLDTLIARLNNIDTIESKAISKILDDTRTFDIMFTTALEQDEMIKASAAMIDETMKSAPEVLDDVIEASNDIIEITKKESALETNAAAKDLNFDFRKLEVMKKHADDIRNAPKNYKEITKSAFKLKMEKISHFIKLIGAPVFYYFVILETIQLFSFNRTQDLKRRGEDPGTKRFTAASLIDSVESALYTAKDLCDIGTIAQKTTAYIAADTALSNLIAFENENIEVLTEQDYIVTTNTAINVFTIGIESSKEKCMPHIGIEIPDNGILKNIFVSKIIDGDTADCRITEGPQSGESFRIRFVGINTPDKDSTSRYTTSCSKYKDAESNTVWTTKDIYELSVDKLWDLTDDNHVTLHIDPSEQTDSTGGRYVAQMFKGEMDINLEMIKSGYACYYHRSDFADVLIDHDEYIAARDEAKAAGLGMWAESESTEFGPVIFRAMYTKDDGTETPLSNVDVTIDETTHYTASFTSERNIIPGIHSATFEKSGYTSITEEFTVVKDVQSIVKVVMIPTDIEIAKGKVVLRAMYTTSAGNTSALSYTDVWVTGEGEQYYFPSSSTERELPSGDYSADFKHTGYTTITKEFTIADGSQQVIQVIMEKGDDEDQPTDDVGYAIFSAYKENSTGTTSTVIATLWLNDTTMLPYESDESIKHKFIPGEHTVIFKKTGYANVEKTFTIVKEEDTPVIAKMTAGTTDDPDTPSAEITFTSSPSSAEIYLDGAFIKLTTARINVSEGEHTVSFKKLNYLSCAKTFTVIADVPQPVSCVLESFEGGGEGEEDPNGWAGYTPPSTYRRPSTSTFELPRYPGSTTSTTEEPPEKIPWELLKSPVKIALVSVGGRLVKQKDILDEIQAFMHKHSDLDVEFEEILHPFIEPEKKDGCAILDDPDYIEDNLDPDKFKDDDEEEKEDFDIIYLLWDPGDNKCVDNPGFTGSMEETVFNAILCSSPIIRVDPKFAATTGKKADMDLDITYNGSITILTQLSEALHELYHATKDEDSPELPDLDKEFCKNNFVNEKPNAKCIVNWLDEFNNAIPEDIKDVEETNPENNPD